MDFERRPAVNLAQYLEMITGKTASLLATAAQFGALAGKRATRCTAPLCQF